MKAFPSGWLLLLLLHLRGYMRFQTVLKSPAADHKSIGESRIARVPMLTWGLRCGCCPVRWPTSRDLLSGPMHDALSAPAAGRADVL